LDRHGFDFPQGLFAGFPREGLPDVCWFWLQLLILESALRRRQHVLFGVTPIPGHADSGEYLPFPMLASHSYL